MPEGRFFISASSPSPPSSIPLTWKRQIKKSLKQESELNCADFLLFLLLHPKRWWASIDGEPQEDSVESSYWCRNLMGSCHCWMKKYFPLLHSIWILQTGKFSCSSAPTQSSSVPTTAEGKTTGPRFGHCCSSCGMLPSSPPGPPLLSSFLVLATEELYSRYNFLFC